MSVAGHDPAQRWEALKRRATERHGEMVVQELREAVAHAWGRRLFRPSWRIVDSPDNAAWRAYRYLGSAGPAEHRYLELGVVCHLDADGNLVGFGVDNGVDFIGLHDTSDYGLRRGLDFIRQQRQQVRIHSEPRYAHKLRLLSTGC